MDFKNQVKEYRDFINSKLDNLLPKEDSFPESLYKSMRYSIFAGGKRLRPILLLSACEVVGGNIDDAIEFACAMEMIHTFSLIHDDLPCIDNDDYRRGMLTNHKVFGEAIAVLAGDGLLNSAAEIMIKTAKNKSGEYLKYIEAMDEIMSASGVNGMICGEVVDIESEGKKIDSKTLEFMYHNKTSKLIIASVRAGAIIGGATNDALERLTQYAKSMGLAFQIRDDILDIIGDQQKLGKNIGSDEENSKSTYTSMYGLDEAKKEVEKLSQSAMQSLEQFGPKSDFLRELANYLVNRES